MLKQTSFCGRGVSFLVILTAINAASMASYALPIKSLEALDSSSEDARWKRRHAHMVTATLVQAADEFQYFSAKRSNSCEARYFEHFVRNPQIIDSQISAIISEARRSGITADGEKTKGKEDPEALYGNAKELLQDARALRIFNQAKEDVLEVLKTDVHFRWDRQLQRIWAERLKHLRLYLSDSPIDAHHHFINPEINPGPNSEPSRVVIGETVAKKIPDATLYFILAHEVAHGIQEIPRSFITCAASSRSRSIPDIEYKNHLERLKSPKGQLDEVAKLDHLKLIVRTLESAGMSDRYLRPGERVELSKAYVKAMGSAVPQHAYVAAGETAADYLGTQALVRRVRLLTKDAETQRRFVLEALNFFLPSPARPAGNLNGLTDPHSNSEHRIFSIYFANRDIQQILGCGFADPISAPYDCSQPDATQSLRLFVERFRSKP